MIAAFCAPSRGAPGAISMSLSARKLPGSRRTTSRKLRSAKFSCVRPRRISVSGCWRRWRRTILATSRSTTWSARNLGTLETLGRLERFEGHLLNWYDLTNLEPLHPRYVSTVDSGNLLASLWTFESSCHELATRALLDGRALRGLADTLGVLRQIMSARRETDCPAALLQVGKIDRGSTGESGGNYYAASVRRAPSRRIWFIRSANPILIRAPTGRARSPGR